MFERLTISANELLVSASLEARWLGLKTFEPEHILVALIGVDNKASTILKNLGADSHRAFKSTASRINQYKSRQAQEPDLQDNDLSPAVAKIVHLAYDEARRCGASAVGPMHIMFALIDSRDFGVDQVFESLQIARDVILKQIGEILAAEPLGEQPVDDHTRLIARARSEVSTWHRRADQSERLGLTSLANEAKALAARWEQEVLKLNGESC
jgi:ATP-dependent Clp protease ATP-binding subunit ClpA